MSSELTEQKCWQHRPNRTGHTQSSGSPNVSVRGLCLPCDGLQWELNSHLYQSACGKRVLFYGVCLTVAEPTDSVQWGLRVRCTWPCGPLPRPAAPGGLVCGQSAAGSTSVPTRSSPPTSAHPLLPRGTYRQTRQDASFTQSVSRDKHN